MLDQAMLIEVEGDDAGRILHNLTTNHVQLLNPGQALESFVTDVRGWVVAHGVVYRSTENRWWIVGQHPSPANVAAHIDRYIIREKAQVQDKSPTFSISVELPGTTSELQAEGLVRIPFDSFEPEASLNVLPKSTEVFQQDVRDWTQLRIAHFWPQMGRDIWEKCIPQELDRSEQAISFTKGCYLGQETIARLDARGQIQKKLCLLKLDGSVAPADKLLFNDQEVGHITSVSNLPPVSLALAVVRRGFFDIDTRLTCNGLAAQIIESASALALLSDE
ncbi:MAG: hypothetical protein U0930_25190 [Pirellulales bacterium]